MIAFDAIGKPQPQGSSKAFVNKRTGRAIVTSDNSGLKFWRNIVAEAARKAMEGQRLIDRPRALDVTISFRVSRPVSLPKKVFHATKKPDADKLLRATLDGMAGVVYRDDAQVVHVELAKVYCAEGEQPGAYVTVEAIDD